MGEVVNQSDNQNKEPNKKRKHEQPDGTERESEQPQPATKLRKPQAPMRKSRKKLKKEERQQKEREEIFDRYKASAIVYLESWKNDKPNWKFSKNTQNWIVAHLYDQELLPDSVWQIALEYFAGSKGIAKTNIIEFATRIIEEAGETTDDDKAVKQSRAKDIIQFIVD